MSAEEIVGGIGDLGTMVYPNVHEIRQTFGTRVQLSSGDTFWIEGLAPERVEHLLGNSRWKTFSSGRTVRVAQVVQLTYGPIPSTEPVETERMDV